MTQVHKTITEGLEKQISQLSIVVGKIQQQISGRLPSQTEPNPEIKNVSMVLCRTVEDEVVRACKGLEKLLKAVSSAEKEESTGTNAARRQPQLKIPGTETSDSRRTYGASRRTFQVRNLFTLRETPPAAHFVPPAVLFRGPEVVKASPLPIQEQGTTPAANFPPPVVQNGRAKLLPGVLLSQNQSNLIQSQSTRRLRR